MIGFLIGVLVTYFWLELRPAGKVYTVKAIESHYHHENQNSETSLIVYEKGNSGHVKEIFCRFPPGFKLSGSNETGWSGIEKVRVGKEAEKYLFGRQSYHCERVK